MSASLAGRRRPAKSRRRSRAGRLNPALYSAATSSIRTQASHRGPTDRVLSTGYSGKRSWLSTESRSIAVVMRSLVLPLYLPGFPHLSGSGHFRPYRALLRSILRRQLHPHQRRHHADSARQSGRKPSSRNAAGSGATLEGDDFRLRRDRYVFHRDGCLGVFPALVVLPFVAGWDWPGISLPLHVRRRVSSSLHRGRVSAMFGGAMRLGSSSGR